MKTMRWLALGLSAGALCLAPVSPSFARQTPSVTQASLQQVIAAAAQKAANQPGFGRLSKAQKLAAIQAAVSLALAETGASSELIAAALVQAVASNVISAGVAISIASAVAPELAQQVAAAPVVVAQLRAEGQTASISTASTNGDGGVSVLVNLQGATTGQGGGTTTTPTPAPYDPCAGVIAAYCGG